jgi:hypothetical protein
MDKLNIEILSLLMNMNLRILIITLLFSTVAVSKLMAMQPNDHVGWLKQCVKKHHLRDHELIEKDYIYAAEFLTNSPNMEDKIKGETRIKNHSIIMKCVYMEQNPGKTEDDYIDFVAKKSGQDVKAVRSALGIKAPLRSKKGKTPQTPAIEPPKQALAETPEKIPAKLSAPKTSKGKLTEYISANGLKLAPAYEEISRQNTAHGLQVLVKITLSPGKDSAEGLGKNKEEAQQDAAKNMLEKLKNPQPMPAKEEKEVPEISVEIKDAATPESVSDIVAQFREDLERGKIEAKATQAAYLAMTEEFERYKIKAQDEINQARESARSAKAEAQSEFAQQREQAKLMIEKAQAEKEDALKHAALAREKASEAQEKLLQAKKDYEKRLENQRSQYKDNLAALNEENRQALTSAQNEIEIGRLSSEKKAQDELDKLRTENLKLKIKNEKLKAQMAQTNTPKLKKEAKGKNDIISPREEASPKVTESGETLSKAASIDTPAIQPEKQSVYSKDQKKVDNLLAQLGVDLALKEHERLNYLIKAQRLDIEGKHELCSNIAKISQSLSSKVHNPDTHETIVKASKKLLKLYNAFNLYYFHKQLIDDCLSRLKINEDKKVMQLITKNNRNREENIELESILNEQRSESIHDDDINDSYILICSLYGLDNGIGDKTTHNIIDNQTTQYKILSHQSLNEKE